MYRKIIFSFILLLIYNNTSAIDFSTLSSRENACTDANVNQTIYIPNWQNSVTDTVWDAFWHPDNRFIANNWTLVKLWQSDSNLVDGCINSAAWQKASDIAPGNNEQIVALYSSCIFNKPTNVNNKTLQFVFNIRHGAIWWWTESITRYYYPRSGWYNTPATRQSKTISNYSVSNYQVHWNECLNVTLAWCWDWVLQSGNWEQCDPNDPAKTGWWSWGCDNTCKPITPPGWSVSCLSLIANPSSGSRPLNTTFTCNTNGASSYEIKITDSTGNVVRTMNPTPNGQVGTGSHTFPSTGTYTASCYINGRDTTPAACTTTITVTEWGGWSSSSSSSSSSSWWGSSSSWGGGGNYCWDWVLQRPNNQMIYEECDFGWSTPWSNWPAWCGKPDSWENACKIIENTQPGWGDISLSPWDTLLLGWWMWVFEYLSSNNATITNSSTSDIFIDKRLCVYKQWFNYGSMSGSSICSTNVIGQLAKNWWVKKLSIADDRFVADISSFPSGITSTDGQIITTLEWLQNSSTFLKSILKVRVAKPSVNTVWWWASLLDGTKLSDVSKLSKDMWPLNAEVNKNLILTSLGTNPLSSYTKTVNDTTLVNKSKTDGQKDLSAFDQKFASGTWETISKLPNQKYNGFDNIFTHNGNVSLSSQKIEWGNKTYIIENGNLTIKWNITSTDNILFVVKQGNVIIENNVTQIDAIVISIGWWNIKAETSSTTKRLVVNGALYGNVDDLLANRTYIKDRWEYVDVGTNINFTSKIFSSPPPLLSKFLWEYMEGNKTPK